MSKIEDEYFLLYQPHCLFNCIYHWRFIRGDDW